VKKSRTWLKSNGRTPLLRQKLDALARRFFGKKSEQLDAA
jgi:hypothetical protein